ncbi:MAG TPA: deoxyhypusine synthase family protein, partial [bacterium]|nr:deoxyhypusine synthase family protein [bacterium]
MKPQEMVDQYAAVKDFIKKHYRHFNSAVVIDAAEAYVQHLNKGGKMLMTLAGAMSTAELGMTLADMIRQDKIHGICSTGANLEEDIFNLVAHKHYRRVPHYRNLSDKEEVALRDQGLNRVTDTCIPEEEAMRRIERQVLKLWQKAGKEKKRFFPYEYMYQLIENGVLEPHFEIDPKDSWVMAACKKNIPIFTPGWEDSTLGNIFVANVIRKEVSDFSVVKSGVEQMAALIEWYRANSKNGSIGFFQIGWG